MSKFIKTLGPDKYASVNSIRKCLANGSTAGSSILLVYPSASAAPAQRQRSLLMYTKQVVFWIFIIFFLVLTIGFVYEFGSGALYFTDKRSSIRVEKS